MLFKRSDDMAREHRLLQRLAEEMDLAGEPIPGQSILELAGDGRVLVENHLGITQYCCEKICVKVKFGHLAISGCNLELTRMTRDQLIITGRIDTVTVHRRKET